MLRAALSPLGEREFRLLFLGRAVSLFGSAFAPIALAFAVLDLTGSARPRPGRCCWFRPAGLLPSRWWHLGRSAAASLRDGGLGLACRRRAGRDRRARPHGCRRDLAPGCAPGSPGRRDFLLLPRRAGDRPAGRQRSPVPRGECTAALDPERHPDRRHSGRRNPGGGNWVGLGARVRRGNVRRRRRLPAGAAASRAT